MRWDDDRTSRLMMLSYASDHVEVRPPSSRRRAMIVVLIAMAAVIAATLAVAVQAVYPESFAYGSADEGAPAAVAALKPERLTLSKEALKPISAEDAAAVNAKVPVVEGPNPAATALAVPLSDATTFTRSLDCMTAAIYYEAANEPIDGQRAVAQVILNRVRHPAYPHSVCGVVFQGSTRRTGCQFSFTCDGSLARVPVQRLWAQARGVASAALAGSVYAPVGWSTHYHANYVVPYWASSLLKTATIGAHIFYRWEGGWGRPGAFSARYAGNEPSQLLTAAQIQAQTPAEAAVADTVAMVASGARIVLAQDVPTAEAVATLPVARNRWVLTSASAQPAAVQPGAAQPGAAEPGRIAEAEPVGDKPRIVPLSAVTKLPAGPATASH